MDKSKDKERQEFEETLSSARLSESELRQTLQDLDNASVNELINIIGMLDAKVARLEEAEKVRSKKAKSKKAKSKKAKSKKD